MFHPIRLKTPAKNKPPWPKQRLKKKYAHVYLRKFSLGTFLPIWNAISWQWLYSN